MSLSNNLHTSGPPPCRGICIATAPDFYIKVQSTEENWSRTLPCFVELSKQLIPASLAVELLETNSSQASFCCIILFVCGTELDITTVALQEQSTIVR